MTTLTDYLFAGFKRRFTGQPDLPDDGGYRIFTTAFDEIVDARELPGLLPRQPPGEPADLDEAVRRLENQFASERVALAAVGAELVRELEGSLPRSERARTVVSFLIDHSGPMHGVRMMAALVAVEAAVGALAGAGIDTEILGFTTASWRGGAARRAWRAAGSPRNPGRLCELRHIVYGAADRPSRIPWQLRLALHAELLRDNVDGEALQWAGSRLDPARWDRRLVCVISGGAPADDSTLLANEDRNLLARHLDAAEESLRADGIAVGFLLIGDGHVREPGFCEHAAAPETAGLALQRLVWRALVPPAWD